MDLECAVGRSTQLRREWSTTKKYLYSRHPNLHMYVHQYSLVRATPAFFWWLPPSLSVRVHTESVLRYAESSRPAPPAWSGLWPSPPIEGRQHWTTLSTIWQKQQLQPPVCLIPPPPTTATATTLTTNTFYPLPEAQPESIRRLGPGDTAHPRCRF